MPKPSGSGHTVTLEADGRVVTMTAEEFDRRVRQFHRMTPEERRTFLERGKKRRGSDPSVSGASDVSELRPGVRGRV
jgi:hypothetical protein